MVSDPHVCIAPEAYSAHDSGELAKAERAEKWTMLSECSVCRGGAQGIRKHWQQIEEEIAFYGFIMVYPMFHEFLACSPFCWGRFSTMTNIQKWKKSPESLGIADHWYPTGAQNISFWYSLSYSHETHILLIRWWKPNFQHVAQKRGWKNPVVASFKPQWEFDTKMGIGWNR